MKHVEYVGDESLFPYGVKTALMREDGKVQLDGPKDMWRANPKYHPLCYGWHEFHPESWKALTK